MDIPPKLPRRIISLTPQLLHDDDDDDKDTFRSFGSATTASLIDDNDDSDDDDNTGAYNKWPPFADKPYDWSIPTNLVYQQATSINAKDSPLQFTQPFQQARSKLDYKVHKNPGLRRQTFQDAILKRVFDQVNDLDSQKDPFIVFTVGPLGAGISYVLTELYQRQLFPLDDCIKIDPEKIQQELPEMAGYHEQRRLDNSNKKARLQVEGEANQLTDVLFEHSLLEDLSILVDIGATLTETSMTWYQQLWERLRKEYQHYRIVLLYVSANRQVLQDRAATREVRMGVDESKKQLLETSMEQVPKCVAALQNMTDVAIEIVNNDEEPLMLKRLHQDDTDDSGTPDWQWFGNFWKTSKDEEIGTNAAADDEDNIPAPPPPVQICSRMSVAFEDSAQHDVARSIWGQAYPNFCARCAVGCDGQCGLCIHGKHICACDVCKQVK